MASAAIVFMHSWPFYYPAAERYAVAQLSATFGFFVDLFFILSGFVIACIYSERVGTRAGFASYMRRRVGRLVPLHLFMVAIAVAAGLMLERLGVRMNNAVDLSASCLASTAAMLHWLGACAGNAPNPQSWSVGAEMAMYLLFPLLLSLPRKALIGAAGLAALVLIASAAQDWMHLPGPLRALPSFILGMAAFEHRDWLARLPHAMAGLAVALFGLFVAAANGADSALTMAVVAATALLAISADMRGGARPALAIAPLGKLSYSIYLTHWLIIAAMLGGLGDRVLSLNPAAMGVLAIGSYVVVLAVSWASFRYFEHPLRTFIGGTAAPPPGGQTDDVALRFSRHP